MHCVLLGDQMTSLLHQVKYLADISAPCIQYIVHISLLSEIDNTRRAINSGINTLVSHELAECPFGGE